MVIHYDCNETSYDNFTTFISLIPKVGAYFWGVWGQGAEEKFGPKKEEVAGGWRRLRKEVHNL
jgi:hypothetical protein